MKEEWEYSEEVGDFVLAHNRRREHVEVGDFWIRVRPPSRQENVESAQNPPIIKFMQPGTMSRITEILAAQPNGGFVSTSYGSLGTVTGLIEMECAGDKLLIDANEFCRSWIRCTPERSWMETDQIRRRSVYQSS